MGASPLQMAPPLRLWTQSCSALDTATATLSWHPQIWLMLQRTGAAISVQHLPFSNLLSKMRQLL